MKILIADDEIEIRSLLSDIAVGAVGSARVLGAGSKSEAMRLLQEHSDIDLIVSEGDLNDGSGWSLQEWNQEKGRRVPFIISSSVDPSGKPEFTTYPPYGTLVKPRLVEPFLELLDRRVRELGIVKLPDGQAATTLPEYCRISLEGLLRANTLPCDLHIRLSDNKFVKILNAGDLFGEADERHYAKKQIEHLYVHRQFLADMLHHLERNILSILSARTVDVDESVEAGAVLHRTVQQHILHLGVTPEVQETIRTHVKLAVQLVKGSDELKSLLKRMRVEPQAYINSHSSALAHFSGALLAMMPWRSDTGYFKLALASLVHDITLENHELAALDSLADLSLKISNFTTAEVNAYRRHPMDCADIVRQITSMPPDVDQIVL